MGWGPRPYVGLGSRTVSVTDRGFLVAHGAMGIKLGLNLTSGMRTPIENTIPDCLTPLSTTPAKPWGREDDSASPRAGVIVHNKYGRSLISVARNTSGLAY